MIRVLKVQAKGQRPLLTAQNQFEVKLQPNTAITAHTVAKSPEIPWTIKNDTLGFLWEFQDFYHMQDVMFNFKPTMRPQSTWTEWWLSFNVKVWPLDLL